MIELAFVGGGAMGGSIIRRLVSLGADPATMIVIDLSSDLRAEYEAMGLQASDDITKVVGAEVVLVAVKPQHLAAALEPLNGLLEGELVVSVVAGVPTRIYEQLLGPVAVIRCMPNTPALIGKGMTALAAGEHVTAEQLERMEMLIGPPTSATARTDAQSSVKPRKFSSGCW